MDTLTLFHRMSVALAIGLIIGLERGWKARAEMEGDRTAGLRTHGLAGLLGGVWGALAALADGDGLVALALGFVGYGAAMTVFFFREAQSEGRHDATNLMAALLAFMLGAFAVAGDTAVAAAAAVAATALLALKQTLHAWLRRLTWDELRSALILLSMSVVMLPVLPSSPIDPWGAINPREIWLMTVLIAALSFAGYALAQVFGERSGTALTGFAGGLVSSTAVTLSMAQRAATEPGRAQTLAGGALISCATMVARVIVVTGFVNLALLQRIVLPLSVGCCILAAAGIYLVRYAGGEKASAPAAQVRLGNPIDFSGVLKFGALLTLIIVASKIATQVGGAAGAYAVAALSGIADVDAVTLSMARHAGSDIATDVAARAIGIVVVVNTLVKAVLGGVTGGVSFAAPVAIASAAALAVGFLVALLV